METPGGLLGVVIGILSCGIVSSLIYCGFSYITLFVLLTPFYVPGFSLCVFVSDEYC
jgi:hypothetical protein